MKKTIAGAACAAALLLAGSAFADTTANIIGADGDSIGTATLKHAPHGVVMRIEIAPGSLTPGWHGMHLHSVGDCSDVGTFKRSKGHINFSKSEHGLLNPKGPDNADLPNLYAAADGSANAEVYTTRVTLAGSMSLRDRDGSALVIHASPDDQMSQPIGGAGGRVACGVIR